MSKPWGYHLSLDLYGCDISLINDGNVLRQWVKDLVKTIDMTAYGEPTVEHFAKHDPEKAGYTVVQLIETSNITAHFVDKNGNGYIDVFSCKEFNPLHVIEQVQAWFHPDDVKQLCMARGTGVEPNHV